MAIYLLFARFFFSPDARGRQPLEQLSENSFFRKVIPVHKQFIKNCHCSFCEHIITFIDSEAFIFASVLISFPLFSVLRILLFLFVKTLVALEGEHGLLMKNYQPCGTTDHRNQRRQQKSSTSLVA